MSAYRPNAVIREVVTLIKANTTIAAKVSDRVFDCPEQECNFPYITVDSVTAVDDGTKDMAGVALTFDVHVWSRYKGKKETGEIQEAVYGLLHQISKAGGSTNAILTESSDFAAWLCRMTYTEIMRDADGETWHGVQRFKVTCYA
jgi:hypothetical protein